MGGDSLLAFFEYPKGIAKVDRDALPWQESHG
jgi:hypothetical protein